MNQKLRWLLFTLLISTIGYSQSDVFHNEWIDYSKTYYKFKVMGFGLDTAGAPITKGIVRIPYATISAAGLSGTPTKDFQLWRDGEEVPLYISTPTGALGNNDYIEFVGEINNGKLDKELYRNPDFQLNDKWSLQTDTAAYFLTVNTTGPNKRFVNVANNVAGNTLPATPYFMYTVGRYFRTLSGGFYTSNGKNLYSSSYDRGEGWVSRAIRPVGSDCGSSTLPQIFVRLYPYLQGPDMTIKVNAIGDAQNSRRVRVNLNNDSITTFQMDYINYAKAVETANVNKISSGNATFTIVDLSPALCDEMRTASIELTYPRLFNFDNLPIFHFSVDASATGRFLQITNFKYLGVAPVLYDIANGKRYTVDISNASVLKVALEPSETPYQLVLTTQSGSYYKTITQVEKRNFINYADPANQGNYLIISNPLIYGSGTSNYVEQYQQYRASAEGGSYNSKVVDVNELIDQFAWGIKKHPLSIKNFIGFANSTFVSAPKYVFLIGKGVTYDEYRSNESNVLAEKLNLVPTWGSPASDNLLASSNMVAIPSIPIGRLSAVSAQEVGDYLLKVKQHDSAQRATTYTINAKGWMKNVIQIAGANDVALGNQLDGYLENYKKIISDTSFGANVIDFSKTKDPSGYPEAVISFKNIYENGASLITYFGHSSATSLDFNLDKPENYNNRNKYPIFIANGCSAGDNYQFETDRLNTKSTISEKFVLSAERGAIGYLASTHYGVLNYLDMFTKSFYKALGVTKYNQSIGAVIKEAITSTLATTNPNDYYARLHAEQYALNGDPAIMLNTAALPDYVIERPQIQVSPAFISVADTTFSVKVMVHNIGRATNDSVSLKITRVSPGGTTETTTKSFAAIDWVDSLIIQVPIVGNRDKGINKITAAVDYKSTITEQSELNNEASTEVTISDAEIRPIYPFKYAVVTDPVFKLAASTVNPLDTLQQYIMELDTTALFNSAFKISKTAVSGGGVVEFDPAVSYTDGTTYYWRVAPYAVTQPHWVNSSFTFNVKGSQGFQQGHLYQNLQSNLTRIAIDSTNGKWSFQNKLHNLFITNSVYPTSGTEDEHFSISVDGSTYIESACVGYSIIFNVFDPITFKPSKNLTQPFNAAETCDSTRQYNFEYQYLTSQTRKNAMDFLDSIPKGSYVTARLILADPYNSFAKDWAKDTTVFGKGNSLYHRLKQYGFAGLDSFSYPRTWAFVFRKGDTTFAPQYVLSQGLFDRITLSVNCATSHEQGTIASPVFGPAKEWKNVYWNGYGVERGNDIETVNVYGIKNDKSEVLLYTLDSSKHMIDISTVNATQYPFIRLQMNNADSVTATPYQLTKWGVGYLPVPEGAVAPNLYFNIPDSVGTLNGTTYNGKLHAGFAFKNVSKADFDSLGVRVVLIDSQHNSIVYPTEKLRPLQAGDTLHIDLDLDVSTFSGWYNLYVEVNPANEQSEQYSFNNFLFKYVYVDPLRVMPVTLLDFNATLQNSTVKTSWLVATETGIKQYEVEHSTNGHVFTKIGTVSTAGTWSLNEKYSFVHPTPVAGKNYYRLKIIDNDGSVKYSSVKLVTLTTSIAINVYPNPVKDLLNISISRPDFKATDVRIINAYGQELWQHKVSGTALVDMKTWATGVYVVQVDKGGSFVTYKIQKQ